MSYILNRVDSLLRMKYVNRLSGTPTINDYNIMEHQYMVAQLFKIFASKDDVPYTIQEFDLILNHDILETETGDLLYTAKNLNDKVKRSWELIEKEISNNFKHLKRYSDDSIRMYLNNRQFALFKCCDLLDLWLFIVSEENLGNKDNRIKDIKERCEELISKLSKNHCFKNLLKFISEWETRN